MLYIVAECRRQKTELIFVFCLRRDINNCTGLDPALDNQNGNAEWPQAACYTATATL